MEKKLEFEDRIKLHKIGWVGQNILWVILFSFVILASLGLFGDGILSYKTLENNNIKVDYEQYLRVGNPKDIKIAIEKNTENINVSFPNIYINAIKMENISPQPLKTTVEGGKTVYQFEIQAPVVITFSINPAKTGKLKGEMQILNTTFQLSHFVYP